MKRNIERLTTVMKQLAEAFLLDASEFFPFGGCINNDGEIGTIAGYVEAENDRPASSDVIAVIEKGILNGLADGSYILAAIGIDVLLKRNGETFDALQLRSFDGLSSFQITLRYTISEQSVDFVPEP